MKTTIKILHVVPHMQIGGINRFVLDLVSCQKSDSNVEVAIYVCSSDKPQWKHLCDNLNVTVYWDHLTGMDINPFHYREFVSVKNRYDVIHWHVYAPLLTLTAWLDKKKHVFTHHSVLGVGRVTKSTDRLKWKMFKAFVNRRLTCEVYNSEFTKHFWQTYGLAATKNALIYNGAVFEDAAELRSSAAQEIVAAVQGNYIIGTSSNFIGCKRINLLIDAFAAFAHNKPDTRLLIVGDGMEAQNLRSQVKRLSIDNKVIFAGHRTDVAVYQSLMDLCVFPSTTETFGLAALECMHLGKPTLCMSDGGGICEVIGAPENIAKDVHDLQAKLEYYYSLDKGQYDAASEQAKKRSDLFIMTEKAQEYNKLYKSLCWPRS